MKKVSKTHTYSTLITDLASLIEQGRKAAVRYVNTALVATYWLIGRRIVEYEQKGKKRAEYGEVLLERISKDLSPIFGKGFSLRNLRNMRSFYLLFPIWQTVSAESSKLGNRQTPSAELSAILQTPSEISETLIRKLPLSWSHYCLLMRLDEPFKREFYEAECIRGNWSVRQLDRQIQSMLYERTALSKRKLAVIAKAHESPLLSKQKIGGQIYEI
jgi:hypothetical protein